MGASLDWSRYAYTLDEKRYHAVMTAFKNMYDAMGTWIHQGEFDWETVGRPIAYGVGGNSVIQMVDLATAKMDIDSEERRVADYIGW